MSRKWSDVKGQGHSAAVGDHCNAGQLLGRRALAKMQILVRQVWGWGPRVCFSEKQVQLLPVARVLGSGGKTWTESRASPGLRLLLSIRHGSG